MRLVDHGGDMGGPSDWALLARYLSGECSEEEKAEVEAWIASDPEKQRLMASMRAVWDTPDPQPMTSDVSRLWDEIAEKTGIATKSEAPGDRSRQGVVVRMVEWFQPKVRRYAAAAALLIVASLAYFWTSWDRSASEFRTLAVEGGGRDELTLSDGTRIALDAGSLLRYPEVFNGDTREVFLSGEGYFGVAPDAEKPFVVHANHAVVTVLGTRFNVRAWGTEQRVTVAVAEGKVSLGSEGRVQEAVEIVKGQGSTLPAAGQPSEPQSVDIEKHMGWMHQEAFFDGAPLHEILYQLERWYNVRFVLEDAAVAAEQLTVHIQAKSLDDVLELISALTGLDYQRTDDLIRLEPGD